MTFEGQEFEAVVVESTSGTVASFGVTLVAMASASPVADKTVVSEFETSVLRKSGVEALAVGISAWLLSPMLFLELAWLREDLVSLSGSMRLNRDLEDLFSPVVELFAVILKSYADSA